MSDLPPDSLLLPQQCDIVHVLDIKAECDAYLNGASAVTIDASQVEKLTTPVVQLLLAIKTLCAANQREFSIINPSDDCSNACVLLGVADQLLEGDLS